MRKLQRLSTWLIIELMSVIYPKLTAGSLAKRLNVSVRTATDLMIAFKNEYNGAVKYDEKKKRTEHVLEGDFKFLPVNADQFVKIALSDSFYQEIMDNVTHIPYLNVQNIANERVSKLEIYCIVFRAISGKTAISMKYLSRKGMQTLEFSPHVFVEAADRVHIRGYTKSTDGRGRYADLVLNRIVSAEDIGSKLYVESYMDSDWDEPAVVKFKLLSISIHIDKIVRQEYYIDNNGLLVLKTRKAIVRYVERMIMNRRFEGVDGPVFELM